MIPTPASGLVPLTRLFVVIGFDAANVGRLLGHEDLHQVVQTGFELHASLQTHIDNAVIPLCMYARVYSIGGACLVVLLLEVSSGRGVHFQGTWRRLLDLWRNWLPPSDCGTAGCCSCQQNLAHMYTDE